MFFWAPVIKVGIVLTNVSQFYKPVEEISSKMQFGIKFITSNVMQWMHMDKMDLGC